MVALYVLALLSVGDTVLLLRRSPSLSFGAGLYSMVGGKVEEGERALHALRREIQEELALDIPESAFTLVHTFHREGTEHNLVALVFAADITGLPSAQNNEPDKHDDLCYFHYDALPTNMIPAHRRAIECIGKHITYSEHGWH